MYHSTASIFTPIVTGHQAPVEKKLLHFTVQWRETGQLFEAGAHLVIQDGGAHTHLTTYHTLKGKHTPLYTLSSKCKIKILYCLKPNNSVFQIFIFWTIQKKSFCYKHYLETLTINILMLMVKCSTTSARSLPGVTYESSFLHRCLFAHFFRDNHQRQMSRRFKGL